LKTWSASWLFWALLSAIFAAVTVIFAKLGVANINSDLATLFRTVVIAVILAAILALTKQYQPLASISARTYAFLALSGIATGASWLCYFRALKLGEASRVAPVDKLSIVLVAVFGAAFLGERLTAANWSGIPYWLRRAARRLQGLIQAKVHSSGTPAGSSGFAVHGLARGPSRSANLARLRRSRLAHCDPRTIPTASVAAAGWGRGGCPNRLERPDRRCP
jgi:transporter family protein